MLLQFAHMIPTGLAILGEDAEALFVNEVLSYQRILTFWILI